MLDLAYRSLTREGDDAYLIGQVSDRPRADHLWHHWIPWMAMLDREHLRLRPLGQVLAEGRPFVFPVELRWEFIEWATRGMDSDFLAPHIPPTVLNAARAGKAIILLFFGHEARALSYVRSGEKRSAYDLIFDFLCRHDLPRGSLWFVSGNLAGQSEYDSWKGRRLGNTNMPDPFEPRFVEPFSYLAQAMRLMQESGFDLTVELQGTTSANGFYMHRTVRLALKPTGLNASAMEPERLHRADTLPPKLFLCMNRRPHKHRRTIVCHLIRRGFLERSLVSFRDDHPEPAHCDQAEMEAAWRELQRRQPLTIDRDLPLDHESYFRDNSAAIKIGELWPYRDTCLSIVTETHFEHDRLFMSEKLWKPIANRHPFIVVGTPGTLAYLHSLGFQTFMPMVDERYDSLVDNEQRMGALFSVIDALGALDDERRIAMLEQMKTILAHNERNLRELRSPMARLLADIDAKLASSG
jgi:hypothetical protein